MTLNSRLAAAVEADIIDAATAAKLEAFLRASDDATDAAQDHTQTETRDGSVDAENVRFARGFHDVFLTIGIVILLLGVVFLFGNLAGAAVAALTAWGLAEIYARRRKLVLPGIALAIGFVLSAGFLATVLLTAAEFSLTSPTSGPGSEDVFSGISGALAALLASILFFWRFGLPFALGLIAISAIALMASVLALAVPDLFDLYARGLFLVAGLVIFWIAMRFDLSDRWRTTISADKAFWLHLIAAPLIMHSAFGASVFESSADTPPPFQPLILIVLIAMLALVAIAIDRRAMLVAGLTYFGSALYSVIDATSIGNDPVMPLTLLLVGAFVVILGTNWITVRRIVVTNLVPTSLADRLTPLTSRTP